MRACPVSPTVGTPSFVLLVSVSYSKPLSISTLLLPSPLFCTWICTGMRSISSSRWEMMPTRRFDCPAISRSFSSVASTESRLFSSSVPKPSSMKRMFTFMSGRLSDESANDNASEIMKRSPPENTVMLRTWFLL